MKYEKVDRLVTEFALKHNVEEKAVKAFASKITSEVLSGLVIHEIALVPPAVQQPAPVPQAQEPAKVEASSASELPVLAKEPEKASPALVPVRRTQQSRKKDALPVLAPLTKAAEKAVGVRQPNPETEAVRNKVIEMVRRGGIQRDFTVKELATLLHENHFVVNNTIRYFAGKGVFEQVGKKPKEPGESGRAEVLWRVNPTG